MVTCRNILVIGVTLLVSSCFNAQTPQKNLSQEETIKMFQTHFNDANYKDLFSLFNADMKERNGLEKVQINLSPLRQNLGDIQNLELVSIGKTSQSYKGSFDKGFLRFTFSFDTKNMLSSMEITPYVDEESVDLKRNTSSFILPFYGKWYVFWGGRTIAENYHNAYPSMYGAFDFWVKGPNGKSHRTDGRRNEDYYAFGKELIAPVDAVVVRVGMGVEDNIWPKMNKIQPYGNFIMLKTRKNEFILFAHLKKNSIKVKEGQRILQGELIGLCGNSGNSTEPHLHFALQNSNDLISAKGANSFFQEILVNGKKRKDYSPVKGDLIQNVD